MEVEAIAGVVIVAPRPGLHEHIGASSRSSVTSFASRRATRGMIRSRIARTSAILGMGSITNKVTWLKAAYYMGERGVD